MRADRPRFDLGPDIVRPEIVGLKAIEPEIVERFLFGCGPLRVRHGRHVLGMAYTISILIVQFYRYLIGEIWGRASSKVFYI